MVSVGAPTPNPTQGKIRNHKWACLFWPAQCQAAALQIPAAGASSLCGWQRGPTTKTCICTARPHSSQEDTGPHGHGPWAGRGRRRTGRPLGQTAQTVGHWAQGPGLSLIVVINWILPTGQSHRNATCTIRTSILFLYPGRLVITRNPYSSYLRHEATT